jgi:hypothetical protein
MTSPFVMWRKEHLRDVGVLQGVCLHASNPVTWFDEHVQGDIRCVSLTYHAASNFWAQQVIHTSGCHEQTALLRETQQSFGVKSLTSS